jgi:hypothetical protein
MLPEVQSSGPGNSDSLASLLPNLACKRNDQQRTLTLARVQLWCCSGGTTSLHSSDNLVICCKETYRAKDYPLRRRVLTEQVPTIDKID